MIPFIIVAEMRTGSTLLSTTLDGHPRVRCYGELLHGEDLPDNQVPGCERRRLTGGELIRRAFAGEAFEAVGFRAMAFLPPPSEPQWSDAWDSLRGVEGLRVIYLTRQDRLAQYASTVIAEQTGLYHPHDNDPIYLPENRPRIEIDARAFKGWIKDRDRLFGRRRRQVQGKLSLEINYERLTGAWPETIMKVQAFLSVAPLELRPAKRKQETRPLSEAIANYEQLRKELV